VIPALKQMHPGSALRDDPADRFLALLLDIADERPVFAMFDFRWAKSADQEFRRSR
jgi:hypothetical protein